MQLKLDFEPGITERHKTILSCIRESAYKSNKALKAIAAGGAKAFYEGEIATDIIATVRGDENPGVHIRNRQFLRGFGVKWFRCGVGDDATCKGPRALDGGDSGVDPSHHC